MYVTRLGYFGSAGTEIKVCQITKNDLVYVGVTFHCFFQFDLESITSNEDVSSQAI